MNLKRRLVIAEDCCEHCKRELEDVLHSLWGCPLLSPVWTYYTCWNFRDTKVFMNFIEDSKDLALFATIAWFVWYQRNAMRTSSVQYSIQQVLHEAQATRIAYVRSIPPKPPDQSNEATQHLNWKPPPWPKVKVNFDGSLFRKDNTAGSRVIIRDNSGQVVASMVGKRALPTLLLLWKYRQLFMHSGWH